MNSAVTVVSVNLWSKCEFTKENMKNYKDLKNWKRSNKRILKSYIRQYCRRYITFSDGRITQYMHQVACIYIAVTQQKRNNTYLEFIYKLEGGYCRLLSSRWKVERLKRANEN